MKRRSMNPRQMTILVGLFVGKTIKVAVIEWAYWEDHEDLDVITEPGQTLIDIPAVSAPDHGTACLSIINALPDEEEK